MSAASGSSLALAAVPVWVVLAALWLWALPPGSRWRDRVYPLLPLAMAALAAFGWAPGFLVTHLHLGLGLWLALTGVWGLSLLKRDASIMDMAYGLLVLGAAGWLGAHLGALTQPSGVLLMALVTLGFGRYSVYIVWRNLPHGEDPRYARWRERAGARFWWWSYFQVFLLQGVVIWLWCLPLALAMAAAGPLNAWHLVGAAVWAMGFVFEAGGDWQLARFKRLRQNPAQVLQSGLWALSRHPNYFGQACMWWGYGLFALAHPWGWISLPCVAYVTWFMHRGSATSLMERHLARTKPGYAAYCARVPAFFPRLWPRPLSLEEQA